MEILSNIDLKNSIKITLNLPKTAQALPFLKQELLKLKEENKEIALIVLSFVGRRVLASQADAIANLLSNRRHRVYIALLFKNKITIKYGWHKLKSFSKEEKEFVNQNWHETFFLNEGRKFVKQSGGSLFIESLLYKFEF